MREIDERISTITRLRAQLDEAKERIRQLESMFGASQDKAAEYAAALGITHSQSQILVVLMHRIFATQSQLEIILYGGEKEIKCLSLISVQIYKLRKALKLHGVVIATLYGHGYSITPSGKERVDDYMARWRIAGRLPLKAVSLRASIVQQESGDPTNV